MINWQKRILFMLKGWLPVGIMYSIGSISFRNAWVIPETPIDRFLPFIPAALWGYFSFFIFIPMAYLFIRKENLLWLAQSMQIVAIIAGMLFILFPTTFIYPDMQGEGITLNILHNFHQFDSVGNCLPSLHGALTVLSMMALNIDTKPWCRLLINIWGIIILLSVLLLKRHLVIDLMAGILLGYGVGYSLSYFLRYKKKSKELL